MLKRKNKKIIAIFTAGILCMTMACLQLTSCNNETPSHNEETENTANGTDNNKEDNNNSDNSDETDNTDEKDNSENPENTDDKNETDKKPEKTDKSDDEEETQNPSDTADSENPDKKLLKVMNSFNWGTTYNQQTKVLSFERGWKLATFNFVNADTINASNFEYLELSYSDLTLPVVIFRLIYSDGSYSQVYLQDHLNKAYIKLNESKKKAVKSIAFQTIMTDDYYADSASLKLGDFKLVKEMQVTEKAPVVDIVSGNFDDTITGEDITNKIAIGWNASRMSACPHYSTEDLANLRFGLQEDYESKKDADGKPVLDENNNEEIESKILGTSAMGLSIEGNLLPKESQAHLKAGYDHGFKSLRVNVTWFAHIIDEKYTIDPYWMERVKEVVDWAIADGYYVFLNDHHSIYAFMSSPIGYAQGYNLTEADKAESKKFLQAIWKQIATAFNGSYDEHLLFETLNEPRISCSAAENPHGEFWPYEMTKEQIAKGTAVLNEYNQLIVDTIRATGGNNAKRFIMVPPYATDTEDKVVFDTGFKLPTDSVDGRLMLAVHWYPMTHTGIKQYTPELKEKFQRVFYNLYKEFISKGVPVCMTEFNVQNLGEDSKIFTKEARFECLYDFCKLAGQYRISMTAWDDGMVHGIVNRSAPYALTDGEDFYPKLIEAWHEGKKLEPKSPEKTLEDIFTENSDYAVSVLNEAVTLTDWSDPTACTVETYKLFNLKENSIIKLEIEGNTSYKNFAFHLAGTWNKVQINGVVYSENGEQDDNDNFSYAGNNSPLYIKLSAQDATALKNGFDIRGMNVTIKNIQVIF